MRDVASELIALGFTPVHPLLGGGDFVVQDDSDGKGPYIREWRSSTPCPLPELMREAPGKIAREPEAEEHPARLAVVEAKLRQYDGELPN